MIPFKVFRFFLSFLAVLLILSIPGPISPVTGQVEPAPDTRAFLANLPSLHSFISSVKSSRSDQLSGVFVPGVLAFPIVQQPEGDAVYVSALPETLTQFRMAQNYQSIGLLAHNFLAGAAFFNLQPKNELILIYGDGSLKYYQVVEVQRYQALSPYSPYSKFIDLETRAPLSTEQLFLKTYGTGGSALIFQTCIARDKEASWGRLFVLARPLDESQSGLVQALPVIEQALLGASQALSPLNSAVASR